MLYIICELAKNGYIESFDIDMGEWLSNSESIAETG